MVSTHLIGEKMNDIRINATINSEVMEKLNSIKKTIPDFNLSALIRKAIMDYDPLEDLNKHMPKGYLVIRCD